MPLALVLLLPFLLLPSATSARSSSVSQGQSPSTATAAQERALALFVYDLQQAVARTDRRAVAGMVRYPLDVTAGGLQIPVSDSDAFVKLYDTIVSPAVKQVIARARVPAAGRPAAGVVRTSSGGIGFENAVFISPVGDSYRVTRLTVPTGPTSRPPGEMTERQLTFRVNQPTQVSGTLEPGGRDRYVFFARRGTLIDARLSGVPAKTVLLRVIDTTSGEPVDARADTGTRVWTGRVAADATYRIEVVRQPDSGREPLIYTLAVGLK